MSYTHSRLMHGLSLILYWMHRLHWVRGSLVQHTQSAEKDVPLHYKRASLLVIWHGYIPNALDCVDGGMNQLCVTTFVLLRTNTTIIVVTTASTRVAFWQVRARSSSLRLHPHHVRNKTTRFCIRIFTRQTRALGAKRCSRFHQCVFFAHCIHTIALTMSTSMVGNKRPSGTKTTAHRRKRRRTASLCDTFSLADLITNAHNHRHVQAFINMTPPPTTTKGGGDTNTAHSLETMNTPTGRVALYAEYQDGSVATSAVEAWVLFELGGRYIREDGKQYYRHDQRTRLNDSYFMTPAHVIAYTDLIDPSVIRQDRLMQLLNDVYSKRAVTGSLYVRKVASNVKRFCLKGSLRCIEMREIYAPQYSIVLYHGITAYRNARRPSLVLDFDYVPVPHANQIGTGITLRKSTTCIPPPAVSRELYNHYNQNFMRSVPTTWTRRSTEDSVGSITDMGATDLEGLYVTMNNRATINYNLARGYAEELVSGIITPDDVSRVLEDRYTIVEAEWHHITSELERNRVAVIDTDQLSSLFSSDGNDAFLIESYIAQCSLAIDEFLDFFNFSIFCRDPRTCNLRLLRDVMADPTEHMHVWTCTGTLADHAQTFLEKVDEDICIYANCLLEMSDDSDDNNDLLLSSYFDNDNCSYADTNVGSDIISYNGNERSVPWSVLSHASYAKCHANGQEHIAWDVYTASERARIYGTAAVRSIGNVRTPCSKRLLYDSATGKGRATQFACGVHQRRTAGSGPLMAIFNKLHCDAGDAGADYISLPVSIGWRVHCADMKARTCESDLMMM